MASLAGTPQKPNSQPNPKAAANQRRRFSWAFTTRHHTQHRDGVQLSFKAVVSGEWWVGRIRELGSVLSQCSGRTSENAVKTQVWVAISVYVLVAILKKQLRLDLSLHKTSQILSATSFEKARFHWLFHNTTSTLPIQILPANWICATYEGTVLIQESKTRSPQANRKSKIGTGPRYICYSLAHHKYDIL